MAVVGTSFRVQFPGAEETFRNDLLECAKGSVRAGAVMAWANAPGVVSVFDASELRSLLDDGAFDLIVGVDSITNEPAIRKLIQLDGDHAGLIVRAVLHSERAIFHPKVLWFDTGDEFRLLVGSGNLTMGGLLKNWEAYTVTLLSGDERTEGLDAVTGLAAKLVPFLRPIDDPDVLARARMNTGNEATLKAPSSPSAGQEPIADPELQVLICEIPLQTGRQTQANLAKHHYEDFFGFVVGSKRTATFYRVDDAGTTGLPEVRDSVQVVSQNYRIELNGMGGFTYATAHRPIGVFVPGDGREFLYMILTDASPHYACMTSALGTWNTSPSGQMRRATRSFADVQSTCPALPILAAGKPVI